MSLVTLEQIKEGRRHLAIELDVKGSFDPEARLQHLFALIEKNRNRMTPEGQLLQYLLHQNVLNHHSRFGGLAETKVEMHFESAQLMLRLLDIQPESAFGFLFTELHATMAALEAQKHQYWRACLSSLLSMEPARSHPVVDSPGFHQLVEARAIFRLGHCTLALAGFDAALAAGLNLTQREECIVERIRCMRLAGERDEAKRAIKLAHKENLTSSIYQEILWEQLIHESLDSRDFTMMIKRTGAWQTFAAPLQKLEAALWMYASSPYGKTELHQTISALQKKGHSGKDTGPTWRAVQLLELCNNRDVPFSLKSEAIATFMQEVLTQLSVDHAILGLAGLVRYLETAKRQVLHAVVKAEYASLSERYSGGRSSDVLGLFKERRQVTASMPLASAS